MRRRCKVGGARANSKRPKAAKAKRRNAPKAVLRSQSTPIREEVEVARLTRERDKARQQQSATADVLKVISRSPFDLRTVLDTLTAIGRSALCGRQRRHISAGRKSVSTGGDHGFSTEVERFAVEGIPCN